MSVHKLDTKVYFGQKAFIERNGRVLVLRDPLGVIGGQSGIDFPGGKYIWDKSLEKELIREVREETSLEISVGKPFIAWTTKNIRRKGSKAHIVRLGYFCKYVSGIVKLSKEHDKYE